MFSDFVVKFCILYLHFICFRILWCCGWYFDLVACSVSISAYCYCMVSFYLLWSETVENLVLGDCVAVFELPALFAEDIYRCGLIYYRRKYAEYPDSMTELNIHVTVRRNRFLFK
jgi:hypothetical protein